MSGEDPRPKRSLQQIRDAVVRLVDRNMYHLEHQGILEGPQVGLLLKFAEVLDKIGKVQDEEQPAPTQSPSDTFGLKADPGLCSYCGLPANSADCQSRHP